LPVVVYIDNQVSWMRAVMHRRRIKASGKRKRLRQIAFAVNSGGLSSPQSCRTR
jgi:hypothetical protein